MTQSISLRSGKVQLAIIKGEEFNASNMRGRCKGWLLGPGRLEGTAYDAFTRAYNDRRIAYVVYSYRTPIAWFTSEPSPLTPLNNGRWYVVVDKFSASTTRHQGIVATALSLVPFKVEVSATTFHIT